MLRACVCLVVVLSACSSSRIAQRGTREYPVVLVHGLSGFSSVAGVDYFFEVPGTLRSDGFDVHVTTTPPFAPVAIRAQHLVRQLNEILASTHARQLHLVAHSMGGLDARQAIHDGALGSRIATLTTLGTPHRGTHVADTWMNARFAPLDMPRNVAANLYAALVGSPPAFNDAQASVWSLGTLEAQAFNKLFPDDKRVEYFSFAGRTLGHDGHGFCEDGMLPNPEGTDLPPPNLVASALLLTGVDRDRPVANDGLVTVPSAKWGRFVGCLPANHMRLVGHPIQRERLARTWDHVAFYLKLTRWLTGRPQ